jgi:hypothetical protein
VTKRTNYAQEDRRLDMAEIRAERDRQVEKEKQALLEWLRNCKPYDPESPPHR